MASRSEQTEIMVYIGRLRKANELPLEDDLRNKMVELFEEYELLRDNFFAKDIECGGPVGDLIDHLKRLADDVERYELVGAPGIDHDALASKIGDTIGSLSAYRLSCGY